MKNFRLKSITPTENQVQNAIIDYLWHQQALGRIVEFGRYNSGGVSLDQGKKNGKRFLWMVTFWLKGREKSNKGHPDIRGTIAGGRAFFIEIKRPGKKARDEQLDYLEIVKTGGAAAGVAECVEDVIRILDLDRKRAP